MPATILDSILMNAFLFNCTPFRHTSIIHLFRSQSDQSFQSFNSPSIILHYPSIVLQQPFNSPSITFLYITSHTSFVPVSCSMVILLIDSPSRGDPCITKLAQVCSSITRLKKSQTQQSFFAVSQTMLQLHSAHLTATGQSTHHGGYGELTPPWESNSGVPT